MNKLFVSLALGASLLSSPAWAADDSLYKAFGEKPGLVALMDDLMVGLMANERTKPFFEKSNQQRVKEQLVEQLCSLSGGPCQYKGVDMKTVHDGMGVSKTHFNALVEVLQRSMDKRGIAFSMQNRMLALLAPMNRDIIEPSAK